MALAMAGSWPTALVAACALGVAGTAFPIGASLVASLYPHGRRGFAFSVYGAGMGGAAAGNLVPLRAVHDYETVELASLAVALLGFAVLAAVVLRVRPPAPRRRAHPLRTAAALIRLPATRHLSAWYAVAHGGLVAFSLYLPFYLQGAYGLGWTSALLIAAVAAAVAAAACPTGGWLCGRRSPSELLTLGYGAVAVLALALVFAPPVGVGLTFVVVVSAGLGRAWRWP